MQKRSTECKWIINLLYTDLRVTISRQLTIIKFALFVLPFWSDLHAPTPALSSRHWNGVTWSEHLTPVWMQGLLKGYFSLQAGWDSRKITAACLCVPIRCEEDWNSSFCDGGLAIFLIMEIAATTSCASLTNVLRDYTYMVIVQINKLQHPPTAIRKRSTQLNKCWHRCSAI